MTSLRVLQPRLICAPFLTPSRSLSLLFKDDLIKMFHLTRTHEEVERSEKLLRKFVDSHSNDEDKSTNVRTCHFVEVSTRFYTLLPHPTQSIYSQTLRLLLREFFKMCHLLQHVEAMRRLWADKAIMTSDLLVDDRGDLAKGVPFMLMPFLDLLLKREEHAEVVSVFEEVEAMSKANSALDTLALAAHMRLGTEESFAKAREIVNKDKRGSAKNRQGVIYVTFLCKRGSWREAFEEVSMMRVRRYRSFRFGHVFKRNVCSHSSLMCIRAI